MKHIHACNYRDTKFRAIQFNLPTFTFKKSQLKMSNAETTQRRKKKRNETYNIYIYKVLKQVHPEIGVSKQAMKILNSFVNDIFGQLAYEAGNLVKYSKRHTMTAREIQTATRLILPGELSKHAVSEGSKAMQKFKK